jgi:osmotically inducible protein OsmC
MGRASAVAISRAATASIGRRIEDEMAPATKVVYTARAHTTGGRDGESRTDDGRLEVRLADPKAPGTGTNPEQLLAVGWSACFLSALQLVAGKMKVPFPPDASDDLEIDLCVGAEGFELRARHNIRLPGVEPTTARELVEAAHRTCPYSKATRGNIDVESLIL